MYSILKHYYSITHTHTHTHTRGGITTVALTFCSTRRNPPLPTGVRSSESAPS